MATSMMQAQQESDNRPIVWFDIDNTLYPASSKISQAMGERIHAYFLSLGFPAEEASELHHKYYTQYGLALRGLTRHHNVDPLDFDRKCDGSLPLEEMIRPNPTIRKLFQDLDRSKVRVWALTNAYRLHAQRVLRILDLEDQLDGLVYCDYCQPNFVCKPEPDFYFKALEQAKASKSTKCFFVDDNRANIDAAKTMGWECVHYCERGSELVEGDDAQELGRRPVQNRSLSVINNLEELRVIWPDIFKK